MNCDEFRKQCLVDPTSKESGFARHKLECTGCTQFFEQAGFFEIKIRNAVKINPPADLKQKLHPVNFEKTANKRLRPIALNVAAASMLVALGVLFSNWLSDENTDIPRQALEHVYEDEAHLAEGGFIAVADLQTVFEGMNIDLPETLDEVKFATICPIGKGLGIHLVLEGEYGPVTVLLMPDAPISGRQQIRDNRYFGFVAPAPKLDGSLVILGEKGESLDDIEFRLRNSLRWI